jgi:hypothetical protein
MSASWRNNRIAAWFAIFAILLAALAPTISHAANAAKGGMSWIEICTTGGSALIQVPQDQAAGKPAQQSVHLEHCPFCSTHGGHLGLPPANVASLPVAQGQALVPELFHRAPRPLFVWAAGQPRAPPIV